MSNGVTHARAIAGITMALALTAAATESRAQSDPGTRAARTAAMQATMHTYFHGEKYEGLFFMGAGVASAVAGALAVSRGTDFGRALSGPLFALGFIQAVAGAVVFFRTDAQVARLDAQSTGDPAAFRAGELPRMRAVNRQFVLLEIVESVLIIGGLVTTAVGFAVNSEIAAGIGLGLALEAGSIFTLDQFAHARGRVYERALEGFSLTVAPAGVATGGAGGLAYGVTWATRF